MLHSLDRPRLLWRRLRCPSSIILRIVGLLNGEEALFREDDLAVTTFVESENEEIEEAALSIRLAYLSLSLIPLARRSLLCL